MLPEVSITNTTYSLSAGMPATSDWSRGRRSLLRLQALHLLGQLLLRGEHAAGQDVLHLGQLAAGLPLAPHVA